MPSLATPLMEQLFSGAAAAAEPGPETGGGLLLEDGTFFLLLESGDFFLLEG